MLPLTVTENFLTAEECQMWIKFHAENHHIYGEKHGETEVLDLQECSHAMFSKNKLDDFFPQIKYLNARLTAHIQSIDSESYVNYSQIVRWPDRSFQPKHLDMPFHTYTSIIYLNDNFTGGATRVDNVDVIPETGKMITFSGNEIYHQVLEIISGYRYTIPVWYRTISVIAQL